jgi:hypothetical protein
MDVLRRSSRISRKERIRNVTIRQWDWGGVVVKALRY